MQPDTTDPTPIANVTPEEELHEISLDELVRWGKLTKRQASKASRWQEARGVGPRKAIEQLRLLKREEMLTALSQRYSYPILEDTPEHRKFSRELVAGYDPFGTAAEAIRSIRSSIASTALVQGTRSMVVMGPHEKVGATYLSCNLAVAFAQMGIPTLLVDANLRDPRVAQVFGIPPRTEGLSELLRRKNSSSGSLNTEVLPGLSVLTAGSVPPNPQELLSSPEFLALTDAVHERFGVVLYDTAPCADYSDAFVVASRIAAAIVVARRHKSSYHDVANVSRKLETIRCTLIGTVFNRY